MRLVLKTGREKSIHRRHPWIFSGAVAHVVGDPQPGNTVEVADSAGGFLAWAAYSPKSQIIGRVWSWDSREPVNADLLARRLRTAIEFRRSWIPEPGQPDHAERLVHAESDGLPGLVVDRYGKVLVVQISSQGAEFWKETLLELLADLQPGCSIYERSDVDLRTLEGLEPQTGLLWGDPVCEPVEIIENQVRFAVDVVNGHKTGFYLDQRDNRRIVRQLAHNREVLDCFCYTGGFTINAISGGAASVVAVDASASALAQAAGNYTLNKLPGERVTWQEGDVFHVLRGMRDRGRQFDMVILDPPKFAQTASQVERAARGYKDINLLGIKLLRPGGILVTFSCSGGVSEDLFQKIISGAAMDAGVDGKILYHLSQSIDHPVVLSFPEGAYLKGLVIQKPWI